MEIGKGRWGTEGSGRSEQEPTRGDGSSGVGTTPESGGSQLPSQPYAPRHIHRHAGPRTEPPLHRDRPSDVWRRHPTGHLLHRRHCVRDLRRAPQLRLHQCPGELPREQLQTHRCPSVSTPSSNSLTTHPCRTVRVSEFRVDTCVSGTRVRVVSWLGVLYPLRNDELKGNTEVIGRQRPNPRWSAEKTSARPVFVTLTFPNNT